MVRFRCQHLAGFKVRHFDPVFLSDSMDKEQSYPVIFELDNADSQPANLSRKLRRVAARRCEAART